MSSTDQPYTHEQMITDINSQAYRHDADFRAYVESRVASMESRATGRSYASGVVDLGKGVTIGGFTAENTASRRFGIDTSLTTHSVDPDAVYEGDGIHSAADLVEVINSHGYKTNPRVREQVARAIEAIGAPLDRKV